MPDSTALVEQLRRLRHEFDAGFAAPALPPTTDRIQLLVVRAAGQPQAIRITDLARLERCPALVPLPMQHAAFLGLGAVRGRATAVYALARLLGLPQGEGGHRWLLMTHAGIALGVPQLLGSLEVAPEALMLGPGAAAGSTPLVALGGGHCPVVDLPALVHPLLSAAAPPSPSLE